ncbi:MAG: hypothetical protein GYA12_04135 [Chloroflexi bacterium]|nr:hypothetical protein [Chloroflexota bacterium]BCY17991.1 hypothetical protein hrd7_18400 [Leptolinea sp. HRD-7]
MPDPFKFLKNIDKQFASQIVLVILFLLACFWIAMLPNPFEVNETPPPPPNQQTLPPNPQQMAARATAYQIEIENNRDQTSGIVIGGVILVGLVITGWLLVINRH